MPFQELANDPNTIFGLIEIVQAKFQECLAVISLLLRVLQQLRGVRQTESDTDAREWPFLRHGR
jgi:hypothetical protein